MQEWVSHLESLIPEKDDCYNLFMELTRDPMNDQRWQRIQRVVRHRRFLSPDIKGPLSVATRLNINWVLERMAQKDPELIQTKPTDYTPLLHAIEAGNPEAFKSLYEAGSFDINEMVQDDFDGDLMSPLRVAIESGRPEIVDTVLSMGPDIHLRFPPYNQTFLHIACNPGLHSPDVDVISRLLEYHVQVDIINTRDANGLTPFHYLAQRCTDEEGVEAFQFLVRHGSNVHAMTNRGQTALAIAEQFESVSKGEEWYRPRVAVIEYLRSVTNLPESSGRSCEIGLDRSK